MTPVGIRVAIVALMLSVAGVAGESAENTTSYLDTGTTGTTFSGDDLTTSVIHQTGNWTSTPSASTASQGNDITTAQTPSNSATTENGSTTASTASQGNGITTAQTPSISATTENGSTTASTASQGNGITTTQTPSTSATTENGSTTPSAAKQGKDTTTAPNPSITENGSKAASTGRLDNGTIALLFLAGAMLILPCVACVLLRYLRKRSEEKLRLKNARSKGNEIRLTHIAKLKDNDEVGVDVPAEVVIEDETTTTALVAQKEAVDDGETKAVDSSTAPSTTDTTTDNASGKDGEKSQPPESAGKASAVDGGEPQKAESVGKKDGDEEKGAAEDGEKDGGTPGEKGSDGDQKDGEKEEKSAAYTGEIPAPILEGQAEETNSTASQTDAPKQAMKDQSNPQTLLADIIDPNRDKKKADSSTPADGGDGLAEGPSTSKKPIAAPRPAKKTRRKSVFHTGADLLASVLGKKKHETLKKD